MRQQPGKQEESYPERFWDVNVIHPQGFRAVLDAVDTRKDNANPLEVVDMRRCHNVDDPVLEGRLEAWRGAPQSTCNAGSSSLSCCKDDEVVKPQRRSQRLVGPGDESRWGMDIYINTCAYLCGC